MTETPLPNSFRSGPDERGHFGAYGGRYVAETLMPLILDLEREYRAAKEDAAFKAEFDDLLANYVGRPSPLYYAERLTEHVRESAPAGKGAQIWFKRDELNHTGAHKINHCLGEALLAKFMGKKKVIAETGAGQHGVHRKAHRLPKRHPPVEARPDAGEVAPSCILHVRPVLQIARIPRRLAVHDSRPR